VESGTCAQRTGSSPVSTSAARSLEIARTIPDERSRVYALTGLVPRLGELGEGKEALEIARTIPNEHSRAEALTRLAPHLSAPLLQEALEATLAIADEGSRAEALTGLVPCLGN